MGCGASAQVDDSEAGSSVRISQHLLATETAMKGLNPTETISQAFQRLDEHICRLEGQCPGPRLATMEAWIEYLHGLLTTTESNDLLLDASTNSLIVNENRALDVRESDDQKERQGVAKVRELAIQLAVAFDVQSAARNEEFMASVGRTSITDIDAQLYTDIIDHAKKRANMLLRDYNELRTCYAEQDGILTSVTSGSYSSKAEKHLDDALDSARQMRDKLGGVSEQWRTAGNLLRTSAKGALQAVELWSLVEHARIPSERIALAIDCRHAIQGSIVALNCAQKSLPQVDFKYISQRQVSALQHASIYLLTDMANSARFQHTKKVLGSYQANVAAAVKWLHETFNRTLKKDLNEAEEAVVSIAKQLQNERLVYMNSSNVGGEVYLASGSVAR